ncbi:hypothetical protein AVEN_83711-1 [Araneus ventricosus]|uniref:Uncharacterized protein n=1 Tax=Araneus ventricosus TaxID=182803 RepID=A0A4Y2GBB7_ARAVE|nr:hypothetical protein AVEN_237622-1 [Araneus ventricosus]GBM49994.1 hypothetical protein AVEN_83711-1 [Araneus ventricosus]
MPTLVSPQNTHDTALADSHLRRETSGPFWVHFVGLLAIAASTCVNVLSSVAVFGLPDLLASATEYALLNFLISFETISKIICVQGLSALKILST